MCKACTRRVAYRVLFIEDLSTNYLRTYRNATDLRRVLPLQTDLAEMSAERFAQLSKPTIPRSRHSSDVWRRISQTTWISCGPKSDRSILTTVSPALTLDSSLRSE